MKLYDFLPEQNELDEAAMNPTEFDRAVAQGQEAGVLVGFEFEVHIPEATLKSTTAEPIAEPTPPSKNAAEVDEAFYFDDVLKTNINDSYNGVSMTLEWFDNTFKFKQPLKGFNSVVDAYPEYTNSLLPRIIALYNQVPPKKRKEYTERALRDIQRNDRRFSFSSNKLTDQFRFATAFGHFLYLGSSGQLEQIGSKIRNLSGKRTQWDNFLLWLTDDDQIDSNVSEYFNFDPNSVWSELGLSDEEEDDYLDDEDDENYEQATKILVPALEQMTGRKVQVFYSYHEKTKNITDWYIEPDGSLEASDEGDASAEIVSPPMPAMEAVGALKNFYGLAQQLNLYTNSTTGLHINVSIPGKLDVLKLATFLGDQYVLKYFGRENNTYAKSAEKQIAQRAPDIGAVTVEPQKSKKPNALGQQRTTVSLDMKKLNAIAKDATQGHTDSISNNGKYFSFRHAGGNYLADLPGIYNSVGRFIRAMIIASDPALYRQEYLAKLAKLAQGPENVIARRVTGADKMIEYLRTKGMPVVIMDVMKYKENRGMDKVVQDAISATINSKWKSEYAEFATITPNSANAKTRLVAKFQNPDRKAQAEQAGLDQFAEVVIAPPTISILKDILADTYSTGVSTFSTAGYNTSGFFLRRKAQLPPTDPRTQGLIKKLLQQKYPKK